MLTHQLAPPHQVSTRLAWVDTLRGLAILAVIFHHSDLQVRVGLGATLGIIHTIDSAITPFRMPILMLLSGMLLPRSLTKPWQIYLKGKFTKIGWPYLVWSCGFLAVLAGASSFRDESVTLIDVAKILYDPPTYHWYLAYLVIYYIAVLLLSRAPGLRFSTIPLALAGAAMAEGNLKRFLFLWAFFITGEIIASYWHVLKPLVAHPVAVAGFTAATIPALYLAGTGEQLRYESLWAPCVIAAVFALRPLMIRIAETKMGEAFSSIGQQSMVYYVSHYLVIRVTFYAMTLLGVSNEYILFISAVIIALVVGYALVKLRHHSLVAWLFEWSPKPAHSKTNAKV